MTSTEPRGTEQRAPITQRAPVIVGVDGSPASDRAVEWASAEALSRAVPLRIVHTWAWQLLEPWTARIDRMAVADLKRTGRTTLQHCLGLARRCAGGAELTASTDLIAGYAPDVFADLGREAGLLVLGSHHLNAVGRAVLGSVSSSMVARSACPVVVVGAAPGPAGENPSVVVGLAGAEDDERVLGFAFEFAARRGRPLHAVLCWHPPFADLSQPPPDVARLLLAESVAGWRERYPDVPAHFAVVRDHPVDALVGAAASQELLVVGRRARRMRFGSLLGSVSLGVLHHATCPVAVVPPAPEPAVQPAGPS